MAEKSEQTGEGSSRKFFFGLMGMLALGLGLKKIRSQSAKFIVSRSSNQTGSRTDKKGMTHERA